MGWDGGGSSGPAVGGRLRGQDRVVGRALWALTVDDDDLPGRWVVVDREFQQAQ
jgi:hypothetical protein